MKKFISLMLIILFVFPLTGCSLLKDTPLEGWGDKVSELISKPRNMIFNETPDKTLKQFYEAMNKKDYKAAFELLSKEEQPNMPISKLEETTISSGIVINTVKYRNDDKNSDQATVRYNYNSIDSMSSLIKENGNWKLQYFGPREY